MTDDLPLARRDLIAGRLAAGQAVVSGLLAVEFGVSEDAVRRDLRALAAEGRCRRVYGGALPPTPATAPMAVRMGEGQGRKAALARAAAAMIRPGEFLFLDAGSTNLALVEALPEEAGLTIATNSVDIAAALLRRGDVALILIGGAVNPLVGGAVDAEAVAAVSRLNVDRLFLGACAVSSRDGICAFDHADAAFKRALCAVSRERVVLVTSDKLETRAPHRVAPLVDVERLVVEADAPAAVVAELARVGARVVVAEEAGS